MTQPPDDGSNPNSPCHAPWLVVQNDNNVVIPEATAAVDQAIGVMTFVLESAAEHAEDLAQCLADQMPLPMPMTENSAKTVRPETKADKTKKAWHKVCEAFESFKEMM